MGRLLSYFSLNGCLIVAFLAFGFSACGPDHTERVAKVDSLQQRAQALKERIGKIDTGRTLELEDRIEEQIELFKEHFEKDSMGEKLYKALNDHKSTQEVLEGYQRNMDRVVKGIEKSEGKLKALRKDLRKGRWSEKKAKDHLADEKKVIDKLESSVNELEKRSKAALENFKSYSGVLRENLSLPDSVEWPGPEKQ